MTFDHFKRAEQPLIILKKLDLTSIIGIVKHYSEDNKETILAGPNKLTFTLFSTSPHFNTVSTGMVVEYDGAEHFVISDIDKDNENKKVISCIGYEYTIGKKTFYLAENTMVTLDDSSNEDNILNTVVSLLPGWTIGEVDLLANQWRTVSCSGKSIYNFLMNDISEVFSVLFTFDTLNRVINVKAYENIGSDTGIFLSSRTLINDLHIKEDSSKIVTKMMCYGSDGVTVQRVNPTGLNGIYNFSNFIGSNLISSSLSAKLVTFQADYDAAIPTYRETMFILNRSIDRFVQYHTLRTEAESDWEVTNTGLAGAISIGDATLAADYRAASAVNKEKIEIYQNLMDGLGYQYESSYNVEGYSPGSANEEPQVGIREGLYPAGTYLESIAEVEAEIALTAEQLLDINGDDLIELGFLCWSYDGVLSGVNESFDLEDRFGSDYEELQSVIYEGTFQSNSFYWSVDASEASKQRTSMDLFVQGQRVLAQNCHPIIEFDIDSINFLDLFDYQGYAEELVLGDKVTVEISEDVFERNIRLISTSYSFHDNSLELKYATKLKNVIGMDNFQDRLNTFSSSVQSYSFERSITDSWSTGRSDITSYLNTVFDASKNMITNNIGTNDVIWNSSGIQLSNSSGGGEFENDSLWITRNMIAMSEDNFDSHSLAIGRIPSATSEEGTVFGVAADLLVGKILAGSQLYISNNVDDEEATFLVNGTGAYLKNAEFVVSKIDGPSVTIDASAAHVFSLADEYGSEKFYIEDDGDVYIEGVVSATEFLVNGTNALVSDQISGSFIDGRGIVVSDGTNTTFEVDSLGNVTIGGNLTMTGGSISWGNVNSDPTSTTAYSRATTARNDLLDLVMGDRIGGTFITENYIYSPIISGAEIWGGLYMDEQGQGGFDIVSSGVGYTDYEFYSDTYSSGSKFSFRDTTTGTILYSFNDEKLGFSSSSGNLLGLWYYKGYEVATLDDIGGAGGTAVFG